MEYISLNFIQNNVIRQYGKQKALKSKINNYFGSFVDQHQDIPYVWLEGKAYVRGSFGFQLKKEIEKLLNKQIKPIHPKLFSSDFVIKERDNLYIKQKIEDRKLAIQAKSDARKKVINDKFFDTIKSIKNETPGFRYIGAFDLEFWENDMNLILEFGWSIIDYKGETKTTHLVVQENLKYENGVFSKNNRFARKDTQTVPLKVAMDRFQKEFLDKTDIYVGHGLENDFKVLSINGMNLELDYLDTADIGAVLMGEDHKVSLQRLLNHLKIKHDNLHNAANDVEYLLEALCEMGDL